MNCEDLGLIPVVVASLRKIFFSVQWREASANIYTVHFWKSCFKNMQNLWEHQDLRFGAGRII